MRLVLGTAQFGMDYGLSNNNGKTNIDEVSRIIKYACQNGISLLDSAPSYGDAEIVLGNVVHNNDIRYVLKTPQFENTNISILNARTLSDSFFKSLSDIKKENAYGLIMHSCNDLLKPGGRLLFKEMESIKSNGFVEKIGVSVYEGWQIKEITEKYNIDLIQIPFNIFDQRLLLNGSLKKLKQKNIEIHARSIFLQGLLLMPIDSISNYFLPIRSKLQMIDRVADNLSISKLDMLLSFALSIKEIDQIIVGVNKLSQLKEIIDAHIIQINPENFLNFSIDDPNFINPSKWKL